MFLFFNFLWLSQAAQNSTAGRWPQFALSWYNYIMPSGWLFFPSKSPCCWILSHPEALALLSKRQQDWIHCSVREMLLKGNVKESSIFGTFSCDSRFVCDHHYKITFFNTNNNNNNNNNNRFFWLVGWLFSFMGVLTLSGHLKPN